MNAKILLAALVLFLLTIGAGVYAQDFTKAEMIKFKIAVPAGVIDKAVSVKVSGQQIDMTPITINLARRGIPKNMLNAGIEGISVSGISNAGTKPVRIRMDLVNTTIPVQWTVVAGAPYDRETRTFTDLLMPGKSIPGPGVKIFFELPPEKIHEPLVYDGGLRLSDADTGDLLTFIPIRIINADPSSGTSAAGACH